MSVAVMAIVPAPAPASSQTTRTEYTGPVFGGNQISLKYVRKINETLTLGE